MDNDTRFGRMYAAFNARDAEAVLAYLGADVEWPKAFAGGSAHGKDEVREYWQRQWSEISATVTPRSIRVLPDGRVDVEVEQVVRDLSDQLIGESIVHHVYTLEGDVVVRMEIEP